MKELRAELIDFLHQIIERPADIGVVVQWWQQLLSDGPAPDRILVVTGSGPSGKSTLLKLMAASVSLDKAKVIQLAYLTDNFGLAAVPGKRE